LRGSEFWMLIAMLIGTPRMPDKATGGDGHEVVLEGAIHTTPTDCPETGRVPIGIARKTPMNRSNGTKAFVFLIENRTFFPHRVDCHSSIRDFGLRICRQESTVYVVHPEPTGDLSSPVRPLGQHPSSSVCAHDLDSLEGLIRAG
jgi:hypothetical protein